MKQYLETYIGSNLPDLLLEQMAFFIRDNQICSDDISKVTVQYSWIKQCWTGVIIWTDNSD